MSDELDSDLQAILKDYMEDRKIESKMQQDTLKTLRHIGNQVSALTTKVDDTYLRVVSIEKDLTFIDRRVEKLEEAEEITGVHERDKLLTKLAEEKKLSGEWQKKYEAQSGAWKKWAAGILAGIVISTLGGVMGWVANRLIGPSPPAVRPPATSQR
jgi:hypothetical protein